MLTSYDWGMLKLVRSHHSFTAAVIGEIHYRLKRLFKLSPASTHFLTPLSHCYVFKKGRVKRLIRGERRCRLSWPSSCHSGGERKTSIITPIFSEPVNADPEHEGLHGGRAPKSNCGNWLHHKPTTGQGLEWSVEVVDEDGHPKHPPYGLLKSVRFLGNLKMKLKVGYRPSPICWSLPCCLTLLPTSSDVTAAQCMLTLQHQSQDLG